jgi:hypothetical protein
MASAYLSRTTGTPSSDDIGTFSFWLKRSAIDVNNEYIIQNYVDGSNYGYIRFKSDNQFQHYSSGGGDWERRTNRVFRDISAWYHIVVRIDTTQNTADDRIRLYINGVQETSFSNNTNASQNVNNKLFASGGTFRIGYVSSGTATYFDGQLAHFHYADGQSYAPTVFGETDATTGIWKPKTSPSVTYGNQGFFLKFDNSANMGLDSSGNSNNFTTSGTIIQVPDTPSNIFATINPLDNYYFGGTFSNINNTVTGSSSSYTYCTSTLGVSKGKYYVEAKLSADDSNAARIGAVGRPSTATTNGIGDRQDEIMYQRNGNLKINGTATSSWGSTWTINDIIGIALDLDNNKIYFSKNGTYQASGNPSTGANGQTITAASSTIDGFYRFGFGDNNSTGSCTFQYNFGQGFFGTTAVASAQTPDDGIGVFEYDPPTGYRALCTKSLNAQEYS